MSGRTKKILCAAAIAVVLILAQLLFGGKGGTSSQGDASPAASDAQSATMDAAAPNESEQRIATLEVQCPDDDDLAVVRFSRSDSGWTAAESRALPADSKKIDRFLAGLLDSPSEAVAEDAAAGLGEGEGVRIAATSESGVSKSWTIGLRPEGVYNKTYVRKPGGEAVLLHADLRGDMDLWDNRAGAAPAADLWLDRRAFRFDPWDAVRITAEYPDHRIAFSRDENGEWRADSYVPGGEWSRKGFSDWLEDLAEFTISGDDDDNRIPDGGAVQTITVALAGGGEKTLRVWANHDDTGALVVSSDYPDRVFVLAGWRYRKYFHRMAALFPKSIPMYDMAAIRFLDIRRGGESLKVARRRDGWRAVAVPFTLMPDGVDRLARYLSGWQPEDYATPNQSGSRPAYGGPMVEVTLADGEVCQYRLAGRHPLYPWRYVVVNGQETFSIPDSEVGVMFPGFADLLDLGLVFSGMNDDVIETLVVSIPEEGVVVFRSGGPDAWSVEMDGRIRALSPEERTKIIGEPLLWRNVGLYERDARRPADAAIGSVALVAKDGRSRDLVFLSPQERDVPYIVADDRGYFIDRADFFNWLSAVREATASLRRETEEAPPPSESLLPPDERTEDAGTGAEEAETTHEAGEAEQEPHGLSDEPTEAPEESATDAAPDSEEGDMAPEAENPSEDEAVSRDETDADLDSEAEGTPADGDASASAHDADSPEPVSEAAVSTDEEASSAAVPPPQDPHEATGEDESGTDAAEETPPAVDDGETEAGTEDIVPEAGAEAPVDDGDDDDSDAGAREEPAPTDGLESGEGEAEAEETPAPGDADAAAAVEDGVAADGDESESGLPEAESAFAAPEMPDMEETPADPIK